MSPQFWPPTSGAVAITPSNSVDWSRVSIVKRGGRVFITGVVSRASDISNLDGGTLPVGCRPATELLFPAASMTAGWTPAFAGVIVNSDGVVRLNAPVAVATGSRYIGLNLSFEVAG